MSEEDYYKIIKKLAIYNIYLFKFAAMAVITIVLFVALLLTVKFGLNGSFSLLNSIRFILIVLVVYGMLYAIFYYFFQRLKKKFTNH